MSVWKQLAQWLLLGLLAVAAVPLVIVAFGLAAVPAVVALLALFLVGIWQWASFTTMSPGMAGRVAALRAWRRLHRENAAARRRMRS